MAVQLIYETHSTTRDNEAGIATGWLPGELSEAGVQNAADLGERRRDDGIDVIYASDLQRAVQSTQIALGDSGIPIRTDQRLRECNYGDLNGASVEALKPRTAYIDQPFPGGQSYRQVVAQTENFLSDLLERHGGGRVLVISHSANRWALDNLLLGTRLEDLVEAPFAWQEGWEYTLPTGWSTHSGRNVAARGGEVRTA